MALATPSVLTIDFPITDLIPTVEDLVQAFTDQMREALLARYREERRHSAYAYDNVIDLLDEVMAQASQEIRDQFDCDACDEDAPNL